MLAGQRNWYVWSVIGLAVIGLVLVEAVGSTLDAGPADQPAATAQAEPTPANAKPAAQPAEKSEKTEGAEKAEKAAEPPSDESAEKPETPEEPKPRSIEGLEPVTLKSGLVYYDLKVGEGDETPHKNATVSVHMVGWVKDSGKLIENSRQRGKVLEFQLSNVIVGWQQGIETMKKGGIRRLEVPAALGYGERGLRPAVPPNADLIFEVELVDFVQPPLPSSVEGIAMVETESGLKYWDLVEGDGESPDPMAVVTVHYTGWLKSGEVMFDSSKLRGEPATFRLDQVIPGWTEGVGSMKVGGTRALEIPSELGYGEQGFPPKIPPGATLLFEVELLDVEQPPKQSSIEGIEPVKLDSGVKYYDLTVGEGAELKDNALLTLHYTAWTDDGTLLYSTSQAGKPVKMRLGQFPFPGWQEGVKSMRVGGKRRVEVPPDQSYPDGRRPPGISPETVFIIETRVVDATTPPQQRSVEGIEPVTTESGLKYYDIKVGDGPSPELSDRVRVHYSGWLTDGTLFDSSLEMGEPAEFVLYGVIKGWTEGVQSMKVGGVRRLEIPSKLGYGERGMGAGIPPNADLVFEVELLAIVDKDQPAPPKPGPGD